MATFISPLILFGFFAVLVGFIGKFIYDFQQSKKQTSSEDGFEFKDDFQKLAGIKPYSTSSLDVPTNVTTKKLNEQIVEALLKAAENSEFPKSDESINVRTTKITTIDTNFGDNDPLATIPMSRVSKEGKKKMAEVAKQDISDRLDAQTKQMLESELGPVIDQLAKEVLAKPKKKSNPKQMDGTKSDAPFVKTRKKSTK
jgi:hypothetical protein